VQSGTIELRMPVAGRKAVRLNPEQAFAQALRRARRSRALSQEALGFESGYHRTYISMLERAQMNPSLRTILSLAAALQIPAAQLVRDVEKHLGGPWRRELR
jgi:transcriptional regulator with XRE-family HTH domain